MNASARSILRCLASHGASNSSFVSGKWATRISILSWSCSFLVCWGTPPISRNTQVIAVAFFIVFPCVDRIIAATGFGRLPVGSQRRRSAVSLAPYSPLVGGPQTQPRCISSRTGALPVHSISIDLDSHRIRVEIVQIDFNPKNVPLRVSCNLHFTEVQRAPYPSQGVLPIDHLPPHCAFISGAFTVGGRSREVMLLGVFTHRAVNAKARRQPRHALPHAPDPCSGNAALVSGIKLRDHLSLEQ